MDKKECPNCNGTGRCRHCRGTGALGYPGYGDVRHYTSPCNFCLRSGVCRRCGGRGKV